ncbi:cytochrome C [Microbulbifer sp. TYP-18]|uniref:Vgb family protein n=1 Tax=Microbulbifer sp. TYP-18 TaxID=3230024 RepID=UPI0034C670F4
MMINKYSFLSLLAGGISAYYPAVTLAQPLGDPLVDAICTACHNSATVRNSSGYSAADWAQLTSHMINLSAAPEQQRAITDYLAKNFPPSKRLNPQLAPGDLTLSVREWQVPTLGQRPRDPIQAVDGTIWWVGQWGNILGRLNPETGEMKEYKLPAGAKPHTVTLDAEGRPWYTGNKNATVGYVEPDTGKVVEFPMPDPSAKDPHSAIFDSNGKLWFTLQHSNQVGRLDPKSGKIDLVVLPRPNSRPYGIKIAPDGTVWVACNGQNCLIALDPNTMSIEEVQLPDPATRTRRLAVDQEGQVWFVNSSLGRLGRYQPKTGEIKEWPTPSGKDSHPYAIAIADDAIWFNESSLRPETLVRFDPATEKFQSWVVESGGVKAGLIRHMRASNHGLVAHQTATNSLLEIRWDVAENSSD